MTLQKSTFIGGNVSINLQVIPDITGAGVVTLSRAGKTYPDFTFIFNSSDLANLTIYQQDADSGTFIVNTKVPFPNVLNAGVQSSFQIVICGISLQLFQIAPNGQNQSVASFQNNFIFFISNISVEIDDTLSQNWQIQPSVTQSSAPCVPCSSPIQSQLWWIILLSVGSFLLIVVLIVLIASLCSNGKKSKKQPEIKYVEVQTPPPTTK